MKKLLLLSSILVLQLQVASCEVQSSDLLADVLQESLSSTDSLVPSTTLSIIANLTNVEEVANNENLKWFSYLFMQMPSVCLAVYGIMRSFLDHGLSKVRQND